MNVIPDEWVRLAWEAFDSCVSDCPDIEMRHALAAVAPLIRRAALEEAAGVVEVAAAEVQHNLDANAEEGIPIIDALVRSRDWLRHVDAAIRALDTKEGL